MTQYDRYVIAGTHNITAHVVATPPTVPDLSKAGLREILLALVTAQNRQNELLEVVVEQLAAPHRQRNQELAAWKRANPHVAKACHKAAEKLGKSQVALLSAIVEDVEENEENLVESEYCFNDFIDRFGPRMSNLNIILQMLAQCADNPVKV